MHSIWISSLLEWTHQIPARWLHLHGDTITHLQDEAYLVIKRGNLPLSTDIPYQCNEVGHCSRTNLPSKWKHFRKRWNVNSSVFERSPNMHMTATSVSGHLRWPEYYDATLSLIHHGGTNLYKVPVMIYIYIYVYQYSYFCTVDVPKWQHTIIKCRLHFNKNIVVISIDRDISALKI